MTRRRERMSEVERRFWGALKTLLRMPAWILLGVVLQFPVMLTAGCSSEAQQTATTAAPDPTVSTPAVQPSKPSGQTPISTEQDDDTRAASMHKQPAVKKPTDTSTASNADGGKTPMPPPYALDAILAGVKARQWSLEQGLADYLQAVVYGGQPLPGTNGRGLEAVVRMARTVAARGGPDTRLAQLYRRLVLPIEILERHTGPGMANNHRWFDFFLSPAYADDDCDRVIRQTESGGDDLAGPCYRKQQWPNPHGSGLPLHRIFYPARWLDEGDPLLALVAFARLAIDQSLDVYARLGRVGTITLVFSTGLDPVFEATHAFVGYHSVNSCRVTVLGPALDLEQPAHFQQMLAHELFHCFEAWNAEAQYMLFDGGTVDPTSWWVEGMAEYFGNVVYPHVNLEWGWAGRFDAVSHARSILQLAYDNVVFFQYMGNRWGDGAIVQLMKSLPTSGGRAEQGAALAGFRNMRTMFHDFAQDYMDGKIRDSSGEMLPLNPDQGPTLELPPSARLGTRPFVIRRAQLRFAGEGRYTLTATDSGAPGLYSSRAGDDGEWQPLPETINGADCETTTEAWQLVLTAVAAGSERRVLQIETEQMEGLSDDDCDEEPGEDYGGSCGVNPRYADMPAKIAFMESAGAEPGSTLCHPACSWRCFCAHPEMHSNRLPTLPECYRYVEDSAEVSEHWLPGPGHAPMTRCEWFLSEEYRDYLPGRTFEHLADELSDVFPQATGRISASGVLMNWCMRRCSSTCATP